jgi:hypothetical protein
MMKVFQPLLSNGYCEQVEEEEGGVPDCRTHH